VVLDWLTSITREEVFLCSVVKAELLFGLHKGDPTEATLNRLRDFFAQFDSLSFDDDAAAVYGELRASLERSGNLIGPNDLMIASIAISHGLQLATFNSSEFARVPGLSCLDWERHAS